MIRIAVATDVPDIARLHVKAWQVAYRGHMPDAYLDALDSSKRAVVWSKAIAEPSRLVLVAKEGPALFGFCSLVPARDADAGKETGEIAAIYVDPAHWRAGIGSSLVATTVEAARGTFSELTLWVLSANASARAFYEARGFQIDGLEKTDEEPGFSVHQVRYRRRLI